MPRLRAAEKSAASAAVTHAVGAGPLDHRRQQFYEFLDPCLRYRSRDLDEPVAEGRRMIGALPDHDAALAIGCDKRLGADAVTAFEHHEISVEG